MSKTIRKPSYQLHKASGRGKVRVKGRDVYFSGPYGSPESVAEYDAFVLEWFANQDVTRCRLAVDDLALLYVEHVREHYRKDGAETSEVHCIRLAMRHLIATHGRTRARDFGPMALKDVRQKMVEAGYVRTSINQHVSRIKRMFRWAVENEYLPVAIYQALCTVPGLREGRSKAREAEPVKPVPEGTVTATLPHLTSVLRAMVELQLLSGARPGEVCALRPRDVTLGKDGVWTYRPQSHKTAHHGKERRILIGPKGQGVLRPFLDRDPDAYCFSPRESQAERDATRRAKRNAETVKIPRPREYRDHYTKDTYRRAIERACEEAFGMPRELRDVAATVARMKDASEAERAAAKERLTRAAAEWRKEHCWSPNQLRHSRATIIRERYGIEAAQVVLGHSDPKTTQIYAERDFAMAARIMREIG